MVRGVLVHFWWAAILAAGLVAAGCSGPNRLDSDDAGRTAVYQPGLPNFDLEAVVTYEGDTPGVDVYLGIPHASLVFARRGAAYAAAYERIVRILDRESGRLLREETGRDSVVVSTYEATQAYEPTIVADRLALDPGSYVLEVSVVDLSSEKEAVRRQGVEVVAPQATEPFLSRIRLEGRPAGRLAGEAFEPVVSLHAPSSLDSMRTVVELFNMADPSPVEVTMRLLQFRTDTTVATPPYWLVPPRGSLTHRGVDYGRADTLQVTQRRLRTADGQAFVEFRLPDLAEGIYRTEIAVRPEGAEGEEPVLERRRDLSVKGPAFPRIATLDEMIQALTYIAAGREIETIREGATPEERKRRFDAFWGSLVTNRQAAANLLRSYYSRVEEANLLFTNHKAGWKTDRGMLYIVLGAPLYVDSRIDSEIWYYSYADRDPLNTFVFEKVVFSETPYENFILQRRPFYQQMWSRAIERWRDGVVI